MWTRQLEWLEPMAALRSLGHLPRPSLLDSAMEHPEQGRFSLLAADPFGVFSFDGRKAWWNAEPEPLEGGSGEHVLAALRRRLARYAIEPSPDRPFPCGAIGTIAYDFGWLLDGRVNPRPSADNLIDLAFYDVVIAFDHRRRTCCVLSSGHPAVGGSAQAARAVARGAAFCDLLSAAARHSRPRPIEPIAWRNQVGREDYCEAIDAVREHIRSGDIYQANLSQRFDAERPAGCDDLDLYAAVRRSNPAPFGAFLALDAHAILSTSPELFLRSDGRTVETRPIKGTVRRSDDPRDDRAAAIDLENSSKNRAENVMIVDLLRNDLSRVCRPDSIDVPDLCAVESYAGLHHLVSAVTGTLEPDRDVLDLLAATFPGGSITGAPKSRAMTIIAALECEPRGVYCGAIGLLGFDGSMVLNIAIRTIVVGPSTLSLRVGGGITLLSDPLDEYEETLVKAHRIMAAGSEGVSVRRQTEFVA